MKYSEILGVSQSTAVYRLQRQLLFKAIVDLAQNKCYRCNQSIETIEEFSIDHKQSWRNSAPELFWDLDNIAFSHFKYNASAGGSVSISNLRQRKIGPEGTAWCSKHKDFLPKAKFSKGSRWDGLRESCNDCRKLRYKQGLGR